MSSLVKQMCSLKCRINVDSANGNISIFDMDDNNVENVIDAISDAFDITGIDIIPTVVPPEPEKPVITEDSIEFEKVEFSDAEVQEQVNKLLRTIYWAMYSRKAKSRDICQHLMSTGTEIAMKYYPNAPIKLAIGDIVDCNYGSHLKNEISGGHVHSVICDIDDNGTVYAVPITKASIEGDAAKYLPFLANVDVKYNDSRYTGGTALLKMGRYIHHLRVNAVVGHALPEFFGKLLMALPTTVDFSAKHSDYENELAEKLGDVQNDDSMLSFESSEEQKGEESETETSVEETSGEDVSEASAEEPENNDTEETPVKETSGEGVSEASVEESENNDTEEIPVEETSGEGVSETPTEEPKDKGTKISAEDYLAAIVADALNSLDKSKPVEEQIDGFLDAIGLSKSERIVRNSFVVACIVKKVGYESIILELHNTFPQFKEESIKATLKDEFKKWLAEHPDVKEKYPKVSIMALLKIFAKKMA